MENKSLCVPFINLLKSNLITLPRLNQRAKDIPLLGDYFLADTKLKDKDPNIRPVEVVVPGIDELVTAADLDIKHIDADGAK